ncbi:hypothetical protein HYY71_05175 [Candidatus Woesearchaeota archaeon]|nr:hypothetical protein [Candidatus Woesearchaeota archaeon]
MLKGVRATSWKERIEARRAVKRFRKGSREYVRAMTLIEEHKVTSALRKLKKALEALGVSSHNADAFIFNVLTEDKALVKAEIGILQALLELSQVTRNDPPLRKLERDLAIAILDGTKNYKFAERGERKEYQQIMLIVNEAKADRNKLMANLRLMFQKEANVSILARLPLARGATREKVDILRLQRIAQRIRSLKARFKPKLEKEAEKELIQDTQEIAADLKDAFYNSYTIKKRDILLVLKILYDLHNIKELITKSIQQHYLPQQPSQELLEMIEKTENAIVQDFQTVAQGFRIVIAAIEKLDKEAEKEVGELARAA